LLIAVTEAIVKAREVNDGRQKGWKSKVEVTGVNPASFSIYYFKKSAFCPYSANSGTATGILLSLTATVHTCISVV